MKPQIGTTSLRLHVQDFSFHTNIDNITFRLISCRTTVVAEMTQDVDQREKRKGKVGGEGGEINY